MSNEVNLLEALYKSTAEFNGEPVEQVRERMENLDRRWSAEEEALDAANAGEERAERLRDWHEDNIPRYL